MKSISRRTFLKKTAVTGTFLGFSCKGSLANNIKICDKEFDVIIKNGNIIDGTGKKAFKADIAIKGNLISNIAPAIPASAGKKIIDASGLTVSPGFVDIHTHSAGGGISHNYILQGVTTEIGGNCGKTAVPNKTKSIGTRLEEFEHQKNITNFGTLVGHAAIRNTAMGLADRPPKTSELQAMKKLTAQSMEEGAFGLSSGLEYAPGIFSDINEMIELCHVVKKYDSIYTTHMRNQKEGVLDSVIETLNVAKATGVRAEISHLKMKGKSSWHLVDPVLQAIENGRNSGIDVLCDTYPYTAMNTFLSIMFPEWARAGDSALLGQNSNLLRRLKDENLDSRLRLDTEKIVEQMGGPESLVVKGQSIADMAQQQNKQPYDIMRELIIKTNGGCGVIGFAMSKENVQKILQFKLNLVISDGWGQGSVGSKNAHPRSYATFPRMLGNYVRQKKIMPLPEAIKRMTAMPAEHFQIKDRGLLQKNKFADITIFDFEKIIDTSTFGKANQKPIGIEYVLVNGKVTVEKGELTKIRAGQILKKA